MRYVDPIRDKYLLNDIDKYLKTKKVKNEKEEFIRDRNYLLFVFGVYEGRRIGDILQIRVGDIREDRIILKEQKTGKENILYIHDKVLKQIKSYVKKYSLVQSDYLFPSRKTKNHEQRPLGRQGAYNIIKDIQREFGDKVGNLGTHTLRKTFGYQYYMKTKDVVMLQKLFNHSSPSITLDYIGITNDQKRDAIKKFDPFS